VLVSLSLIIGEFIRGMEEVVYRTWEAGDGVKGGAQTPKVCEIIKEHSLLLI